ncbi:hypothetical protein BS17DRAFT_245951 [Gyrodon lividus]|nr:hypothetical protein BS17DRAFT_245951 [Gyrodon lividus]
MSWTFLRSLGHHQIHLDTCSLRRHIPYIPRALSIRHSRILVLTRMYSTSISFAYIKLLSRYGCVPSLQRVAFLRSSPERCIVTEVPCVYPPGHKRSSSMFSGEHHTGIPKVLLGRLTGHLCVRYTTSSSTNHGLAETWLNAACSEKTQAVHQCRQ